MSATVLSIRQLPTTADGYTVVSINSSPYNATQTRGHVVLLVDATSGNIIVNLPTVVGNTALFTVKKIDLSYNTVTVDGNSAENIDDDLTAVIKIPYSSIDLVTDNANWYVI